MAALGPLTILEDAKVSEEDETMRSWQAAVVWLGLAAGAGQTQAGPIHIVVNRGEYPTAEAAAGDEANVGWDDGQDADDVVCTECYAAVELQRYLREMTGETAGARFAIVDDDQVPPGGELILLGNLHTNKAIAEWGPKLGITGATFADLGPEGYVIKCRGNAGSSTGSAARATGRIMLIGGKGRIGTLYGVYGLLDRLGVRWLSPGAIGEEVPQRPLETLPAMDVSDSPAFVTRGFHAWEYRGNPEFFDWMVRNRMNYWCVQAKDRPGLKKRGIQMNCGNHVLQHRFLSPASPYPYRHSKFPVNDEALPDDPYQVSPEYRGDADGDGKLTYSEAHPEWYGLRKGKRSFNIHGDNGDNFCTSNRYACDEFMKKIVQDLIDGEWADADSINFWTLDGGKWCECEACRALGTPTDRNLLLVHRLRQEMKRAMAQGRLKRNVRIYFLAYADVLEPPTRPLPRDFDYDNCIATYFPIARCYVHTFADPACTEFNTRYQKNFLGWASDPERHYRGQIFIGEYYNVSGYKCLPIMFARTMAVDIPYYHQHGARHMHYMHCTTRNWGTRALTNYHLARLLWDPELDSQALLADYFARRYGPAADVMRRLYDRLDTALSNVTMLKYRLSRRLSRNEKDLFPQRHMKYEETHFDADDGPDLVEMVAAIDECLGLLERARAVKCPQRVRDRLEEDAGPLHYAANTLRFYDVLVRATRLVHAGRRPEARVLVPEMKRLAQALEDDTTSTKWSSSHASAPNALAASYVTKAYQRLVAELEPEVEPPTNTGKRQ